MTAAPHHIAATNTFRLVHHTQDEQARDFDRIEDLLADGLAAARAALEALELLPHEMLKPIETWHRAVTEQVGRRRLLNDQFRGDAEEILRRLARIDVAEADARAHDAVLRRLRDAVNLSHRVADLLAAEKDIGWHRGFRD